MSILPTREKSRYFKKGIVYLKRYKKLSFLLILFAFFSSLFEGFGIGSIVPLFQGLAGGDPGSFTLPVWNKFAPWLSAWPPQNVIAGLLLFFLAMIVLKNLFNYLNLVTVSKITNSTRRDLQTELFAAIADARLQFFTKMRSAHLISSISVYTNNVTTFIYAFFSAFIILARLLVYLVLMLLISWQFTLLVGLIGVILSPLLQFVFVRVKRIGRRVAEEVSGLYFRLTEMFSAVQLMKISSTQEYEKKRFADVARSLARWDFLGSAYSNILRPFSEIATIGILFTVFVYLLLSGRLDATLYLSLIVVYLYVFLQFFTQAGEFIKLLSSMYSNVEAYQKYERVLSEAKQAVEASGSKEISSLRQGITFNDVSFGYESGAPILRHLNFFVPKGSFTALIGPTGVGKTTIVNLLAGLYRPQAGAVTVDGVDVKDLNLQKWRRELGYVAQDVLILNDTVRNNIVYGRFDAGREEVETAARRARIHDFILTLPQGYDTVLGERGVKLSGGERQRVSIARALLRDPEMLILDEATSALDNETERLIQEALSEAARGRTVIAIAHRLSTVKHADNIIVLIGGQVAEQGKHEDLMAKKGFYHYYYNLQFIT